MASKLKKVLSGSFVRGTIVTGFSLAKPTVFGLYSHEGHLFEVGKTSDAEWSTVGFKQNVRCIVDGAIIKDIDGQFLQEEATPKHRRDCKILVDKMISQLGECLGTLSGSVK